MVQVLNKREGIFDEGDQRRFEMLAEQAGAVLEQTTLVQGGEVRGEINGVIGSSAVMREVVGQVRRVAPLSATVLLRGESGTGKGLFARAIHQNSPRRDKPLVVVDCTTLQGKLLTLLQERTYCPVGGQGRREAEIRIVVATNRRLEELVEEGRFREDLYYRLKVVEIGLPALRERSEEDVRELVEYFWRRAARRHGRRLRGVREDAMELLVGYEWPGNVRELANCLETAVIFCDGEVTPSTLSLRRADATRRVRTLGYQEKGSESGGSVEVGDEPTMEEVEGRYMRYLLEKYEGNRSACARVMGIGRNTLLRKIREYGLE